VDVERDEAEVRAGKRRRMAMVEELRKAELVRDRLEGLTNFRETCTRFCERCTSAY
jgi:hypothetical protein